MKARISFATRIRAPLSLSPRFCHFNNTTFHTKAGIQGGSVKVIVDSRNCHNLASEKRCSKKKHACHYKVQWLSDSDSIQVDHIMQVSFKTGAYKYTLECDVVPVSMCHLLLGRPWQFDRAVINNGRTNHYSFKMKGKECVLRPMSPSLVTADKQYSNHHGEPSERMHHLKKSECHKPNE